LQVSSSLIKLALLQIHWLFVGQMWLTYSVATI
jgi:hypothetical protein